MDTITLLLCLWAGEGVGAVDEARQPSSPDPFSRKAKGRIGTVEVTSAVGTGQAGVTTGRGGEAGALLQKLASSCGVKAG